MLLTVITLVFLFLLDAVLVHGLFVRGISYHGCGYGASSSSSEVRGFNRASGDSIPGVLAHVLSACILGARRLLDWLMFALDSCEYCLICMCGP